MGFSPLLAAAIAHPLMAAAIGTTVVAGGYQAYSSIQQANYQSQVAKMNANIAEQNRVAENTQGAADASLVKEKTGREVGGMLAAQGANGVDVGFGTTKDSRDAAQSVGDLDAQTMQYNAQIKGLGFQNQESGYLADSSMAKAAGVDKAIGSVLSTSSSVLGQAYKYKSGGLG